MKIFKILSLLIVGFSIAPILVSISNKKPSAKPSISELEKIRGEKEEILNHPIKQTPQNLEPEPQREPCPCGRR
ncbi:MAG: hypothetical protein V2A53_03340 [bacterium]